MNLLDQEGPQNIRRITRVKVCGITRWEDALCCLSLNVHAVGFNFYSKSPRYLSPAEAQGIIQRLPPLMASIGVFVNESNPAEVERIAHQTGLQGVQLHGEETPEYCRRLASIPVIKAFRLERGFSLDSLKEYAVSAILLDGFKPGEYGGTGMCCDWQAAAVIAQLYPVILSGGLCPANVGQAIKMVKPWAVDVCSGVEFAPGRKDPQKLQAFLNSVRDES